MERGGVPGGWGAKGGRRRVGTGALSSSPPARAAPPPPPPRGALRVPNRAVGAREAGSETCPSAGPGRCRRAPPCPHGCLFLRCCCCCWCLSSSAPWALAGRRPPTSPRKVHPSPAPRTSSTPQLLSLHVSFSHHPRVRTFPHPHPRASWSAATSLLLTSFLSLRITTSTHFLCLTLLHYTVFL